MNKFLALTACLPLRTGKKCPSPLQLFTKCKDLSPSCHTFPGAPPLTHILKATSYPRYLLLSRQRAGWFTCTTPVTHRAKCLRKEGSLWHRAFNGGEPVS